MNMKWPLLDYELGKKRSLPFGEIVGRAYDLAWPVGAYRVTLPQVETGDDRLDVFERLVVEMLKTGLKGVDDLSTETCLEKDMVRAILARLQDMGALDEDGNVIEKNARGDETAPLKCVTAYVFQELAGGRILPYLHLVDAQNGLARDLETDESKLRILPRQSPHELPPVTEKDVATAFRQMMKRGGKADVPHFTLGQIRIMRQPEYYYLRCPLAFQRHDADFRIADPFGNGFSLVLENVFESLLKGDEGTRDWYRKRRERLAAGNNASTSETTNVLSEEGRRKYPKLGYALNPSHAHTFRTLSQLYAAVEWALFYFCQRYPAFKDAIDFLEHTQGSPQRRRDMIVSCLRELGLQTNVPRLFADLENLTSSRVLGFVKGEAEFSVTLVLALLITRFDRDAQEAMKPLAGIGGDRGLLERLMELREDRNEASHGQRTHGEDRELRDDSLVLELVDILLPDARRRDNGGRAAKTANERRLDAIFDARSSLQGQFGVGAFMEFDRQLQESLVESEVSFLPALDEKRADDEFDVRCGISSLYTACQMVFEDVREGHGTSWDGSVPDSRLVALAEEKSNNSGLYKGHFPLSLQPRPGRIRSALQGGQSELGGLILAFLITAPAEDLQDIARENPDFLIRFEQLLAMRRHDNEGEIRKTGGFVREFRKAIYKTIKQLKEV